MKSVKFIILACFALALSYSSAQDITIGNTTLTESEVAVGLQIPWEILWGPDDHIWVTERRGRVFRVEVSSGTTNEILNIQSLVNGSFGEPGLLGMALHPDFDNTPLVYLTYSKAGSNPNRNKLVSYEWNGTELVNEVTLFDNIHAGGIHAGSRIIISQDEKLLITTGDGGDGGSSSQNMLSNGGKLLRLNLDGSIPDDNPISGNPMYSMGHRNAQGLVQTPDGKIYSSEHGQNAQDELNLIEPNNNYGWPNVEGFCDDFPSGANEPSDCEAAGFTEPLIEWRPCQAVAGLDYYNHPAVPELENTLLLSVMKGFSFQSDRGLFLLHLNEDGTEIAFDDSEDIILDNKGRIRDVCVNPNNGTIYIAVNGNSYPGSGPNKIYAYSPPGVDNVNEESSIQQLNIYPNPSAGDVKFEVSEQLLGGTYSVISYDGKEVLSGDITSELFQINDGELNAGSYYVIVKGELGFISRTFIVQ